MVNKNNYQTRISSDRFGNPYQLKFAKQVIDKKTGEFVDGVYKTYVELSGKLYQIEISNANKVLETKNGDVSGKWVKVTHKKIQSNRPSSM